MVYDQDAADQRVFGVEQQDLVKKGNVFGNDQHATHGGNIFAQELDLRVDLVALIFDGFKRKNGAANDDGQSGGHADKK